MMLMNCVLVLSIMFCYVASAQISQIVVQVQVSQMQAGQAQVKGLTV